MKISVLTPSFNSGQYLERAIQSVIQQDYHDWEHIIIDGGSTDNTMEVFKKHKHLKWSSKPDKGQSDAMNQAFKEASGEIVVYLNADDYFEPGAFTTVVNAFKQDCDVDFLLGNHRLILPDGNVSIVDNFKIAAELENLVLKNKRFPLNPVCYFYRKSLQIDIGPFPIDQHFTMDYWFLLRAYHLGKVKRIKNILGTFDQNEGSKTVRCNSFDSQKAISLEFCKHYYPDMEWKVERYFGVTSPYVVSVAKRSIRALINSVHHWLK